MASGRDLLFKPVVIPPTEEVSGVKKADKAGVKLPRGRDLGGLIEEQPGRVSSKVPGESTQPKKPAGADNRHTKSPAFAAAYFNADTSGVRQANLRESKMQALRGSAEVVDLKKIVLPPALIEETPGPEQLRSVGELMGLDGGLDLALETFLGRHGAWARGPGITVELLLERMARFEAMVEARQAALLRMLGVREAKCAFNETVLRAAAVQGQAVQDVQDLTGEGRALIQRTAEQADGLHKRLAKILGVKRKAKT